MVITLASTVCAVDGSDHTVVLLGALGTDRAIWREVSHRLKAAGISTIALDLRGHGDSPVPNGSSTVAEMAADVLGTLDQMGVGPVDLAGVSLGGAVAQHIATDTPERVKTLALLSTSARFGTKDAWAARADSVRADGTTGLVDGLAGRWLTVDYCARNPAQLERVKAMVSRTAAEGYASGAEALGEWDGRNELSAISAPTLVIGGAEDPGIPPGQQAKLAAAIPDASHTTIPGAHLTPVEQPALVADLLAGHILETHKRPPASCHSTKGNER